MQLRRQQGGRDWLYQVRRPGAGLRGITVNAIAPGFIETAMTAKISPRRARRSLKQIPLGSLGQPDDVANAVLFLASPAARYITGQVLSVDGGMAM